MRLQACLSKIIRDLKSKVPIPSFVLGLGCVLAVCGFVFSIAGVAELHQKACKGNPKDALVCDLFGFQWWVVGFEAFVAVLLGVKYFFGVGFFQRSCFDIPIDGVFKRSWLDIPIIGALLFGCMQIDQVLRLTSNNANQSVARNTTVAGFALLFIANILVAGLWGLVWFDERACEGLELSDAQRAAGLVLAGFGISGLAMVAKVVADTCKEACEDDGCFLAVHLLALLFFIATEIGFKVQHFRPMLTILLSFQIRRFEISMADSDVLRRVGLLFTIISAYLLIILCMHWNKSDLASNSKACKHFLGVLSLLGVLVGLIVGYVDLDFGSLSPASRWIFASQIIVLILGILFLIPGKNILANMRLPLIAFMAMAIYESPSWIHAWVTKSESDLKITGIGNMILTISFLLLMMVVGAG